jgi:hypothetical protein
MYVCMYVSIGFARYVTILDTNSFDQFTAFHAILDFLLK